MNDRQFEKFFKDREMQFDEIPPNLVWQNLNKQIHRQKQSFWSLKKLLGGLLGIAILSGLVISMQQMNPDDVPAKESQRTQANKKLTSASKGNPESQKIHKTDFKVTRTSTDSIVKPDKKPRLIVKPLPVYKKSQASDNPANRQVDSLYQTYLKFLKDSVSFSANEENLDVKLLFEPNIKAHLDSLQPQILSPGIRPRLKLGAEHFRKYLKQNYKLQKEVAYKIFVIQFFLEADGTISSLNLINPTKPEADEQLLESIKAYNGGWIPVTRSAKNVRSKQRLRIQWNRPETGIYK